MRTFNLALVLLLLVGALAHADNIAVVNTQILVEDSWAGQALLTPIETQQKAAANMLDASARVLIALSEELTKPLPDNVREEKEKEFETLRLRFLDEREKYFAGIHAEYQTRLDAIRKDIDYAIRIVMKRNGLGLVITVDDNAENILYNDGSDITQQVLDVMDNNYNEGMLNGTKN